MSENNFLVYFVQVLSFMVGGLIHFFPSYLEVDVHSMSSCMLIVVFVFLSVPFIFGKSVSLDIKSLAHIFCTWIFNYVAPFSCGMKCCPWKKYLIKIEFSFPFKSQIKGSVQVYFPGQTSYSFPLMHSLAPGWELKRGIFFDGFFFKSCNFIRICLGFAHSGDWCSPMWGLLFQ